MKYSTELTGQFQRWCCDPVNGVLYDSDGNGFDLNEIRAIFFNRQLIRSLTGTTYGGDVVSLKQHLERKLALVSLPTVTVTWSDGETVQLKHAHF